MIISDVAMQFVTWDGIACGLCLVYFQSENSKTASRKGVEDYEWKFVVRIYFKTIIFGKDFIIDATTTLNIRPSQNTQV